MSCCGLSDRPSASRTMMAMATLVKLVSRPTRLLQHSHSVSMVTTQSHHGHSTVTVKAQSPHGHSHSTATAQSHPTHNHGTRRHAMAQSLVVAHLQDSVSLKSCIRRTIRLQGSVTVTAQSPHSHSTVTVQTQTQSQTQSQSQSQRVKRA